MNETEYLENQAKLRRHKQAKHSQKLSQKKRLKVVGDKIEIRKDLILQQHSILIEESTIIELKKLIKENFKTIKKSTYIRLAVEYCLTHKKFNEEIKRLLD
jgi:hypothetical protein